MRDYEVYTEPPFYDSLNNYKGDDMNEELCWRCGLVRTGKRIDGKPICQICMLSDANANHGILPSYADLRPVGVKYDTPPPATKPEPKKKPKLRTRAKVSDAPLTDTTKRRLRVLNE